MSLDPQNLSVVHYPADVLRTKAAPVPKVTDEVRRVAERMIELMYDAEGIGLAAPQVGLSWQMFVVDIPESEDRSPADDPPSATGGPIVYINPRLHDYEGPPEPFEEGCLSLPDIRGDVLRPPIVSITATDAEGKTFTHRTGGLLARCIQHEFDHLQGVLIIDKLTPLSRLKVRNAVRDLERDAGM